ncbi:MAG: hypothetical protein U0Y68_16575 [Blastocatellia bacterium]
MSEVRRITSNSPVKEPLSSPVRQGFLQFRQALPSPLGGAAQDQNDGFLTELMRGSKVPILFCCGAQGVDRKRVFACVRCRALPAHDELIFRSGGREKRQFLHRRYAAFIAPGSKALSLCILQPHVNADAPRHDRHIHIIISEERE